MLKGQKPSHQIVLSRRKENAPAMIGQHPKQVITYKYRIYIHE